MSRPRVEVEVPALALRRAAATAECGVSLEIFDEHIPPDLATVHVGTVTLYRRAELERFLAESAVVEASAA